MDNDKMLLLCILVNVYGAYKAFTHGSIKRAGANVALIVYCMYLMAR